MSNVGNVSAKVIDGKVIDPGSTKSSATVTGTKSREVEKSSGYDQDAFMNILCAQMKYQDPLEPTSNTEYISQYAQFTQVEQMQNMAKAMTMSRASELVGKTVMVETTNSKGEIEQKEGRVDVVTYSGGEAYLSIDGKDYKMDEVKAVADTTYVEEQEAAENLEKAIDKLPSYYNITLDDLESIQKAVQTYEAMNDRTKSYVDQDRITTLKKYSDRVTELYESALENAEKLAELEKEKAAEDAQDDAAGTGKDADQNTAESASTAGDTSVAGDTSATENAAASGATAVTGSDTSSPATTSAAEEEDDRISAIL
ncbi:MAG: hypothetical protein IJT34_05170 [Butyrivibrio sp.]|nr:hypothetical protein [Butyrivibrio sp.]